MNIKRASVNDTDELRDIFESAEALLLDFDGPVCSVFSGFPAPMVADQLRAVMTDDGHTRLPLEVAESTDPFDILKFAATLSSKDAGYIEAALSAHESEAVRTARPTPGAHDLMRAWHSSGKKLAVVSNNSALAVQSYLDLHSLSQYVDSNCSRNFTDPTLLKPSPFLLEQASSKIGIRPSRCVMLGDSISDIQAARAFGTLSIGYANRPPKVDELANVSDAVTQSINLLLEILRGLEFESGR